MRSIFSHVALATGGLGETRSIRADLARDAGFVALSEAVRGTVEGTEAAAHACRRAAAIATSPGSYPSLRHKAELYINDTMLHDGQQSISAVAF